MKIHVQTKKILKVTGLILNFQLNVVEGESELQSATIFGNVGMFFFNLKMVFFNKKVLIYNAMKFLRGWLYKHGYCVMFLAELLLFLRSRLYCRFHHEVLFSEAQKKLLK